MIPKRTFSHLVSGVSLSWLVVARAWGQDHMHEAGGLILGQPPEYLHATGHSILIVGLSVSLLALLAGWLAKSVAAQAIGLGLVLLCSAMAYPILSLGQDSYNRVRPLADEAGQKWLREHMRRAETSVYAFYLTTAVAAAGLVSLRKWPKAARPLALATLVSGAVSFGLGGWISAAGGQIRHPEFRVPVDHDAEMNKPAASVGAAPEPSTSHEHKH